jgi:hypothetical protein
MRKAAELTETKNFPGFGDWQGPEIALDYFWTIITDC